MNWLNEVENARKSGSFDRSMEILRVELAKRPQDPLIHYQIACTHDALGKEKDAVPAYEKAMDLGLAGDDLRDAYLGLGSTYRTLGEYEKSREVFERGIAQFPEYRPLRVFLSLTLYNLGAADKSVEILLRELVETTTDDDIKSYERALLFYSDKLDQVFE